MSQATITEAITVEANTSRLIFQNFNDIGLSYPNFPQLSISELYSDSNFGDSAVASLLLIRRIEYNDEPTLEFGFSRPQLINRNFAWRVYGSALMFLKGNGNLGLGTESPASKLQVSNGDIFIEDINFGIIMKSPDNQCWRVTINNNGEFISQLVSCPN